jgi:putative endonuclease
VQAVIKMSQEWYVYMLLCDNKSYYIGITPTVQKRVWKHRNNLSLATKEYSDIELVHCEKYRNKYLAAKREKQLKGWSRARKQMLIAGKLGINICTEFDKV